ncbi:Karyopherin (importin) alpha [Pseudoloma neurophilia]|uniref:Importin subunit alpha n=1 Tax=Pseudoloma neurophilia TaxID=146866 RepID=A0A0R0LYK3_9MICR|nr:Karyopherin (importin) alpha [Pseudoloma neurophilia]
MTLPDDRKKHREDQQISLREKKREELLNRKRFTPVDEDVTGILDFKRKKELLISKDPNEVLDGVTKFRKNLSVEQKPPIQQIINAGLVPRFVELLSKANILYTNVDVNLVRKIRSESAWALTNIASGSSEQTQAILNYGAIPLFADMLKENDEDLVDQAAWAFGNISGDSEIMRDAAINCGVLKTALEISKSLYETNSSLRVLKNLAWLISNLNRGLNPPPKYENMLNSLEVLKLLVDHFDEDIKNDSLWAISYICDNNEEIIKKVIEYGLINKVLMNIFDHQNYTSTKIILPSLRAIGNIITNMDDNVDLVLKQNVVPVFCDMFKNFEGDVAIKKLRKEICWIISNIACGTENQINFIMNEEVLEILYSTITLQNYIKLEACFALTNMLKFINTNYKHFEMILSPKFFKFLLDCLESFDTYKEIRIQILRSVKKIIICTRDWKIKKGTSMFFQKQNYYTDLMESIETLQYEEDDTEVREVAETVYAEYEKDAPELQNEFR